MILVDHIIDADPNKMRPAISRFRCFASSSDNKDLEALRDATMSLIEDLHCLRYLQLDRYLRTHWSQRWSLWGLSSQDPSPPTPAFDLQYHDMKSASSALMFRGLIQPSVHQGLRYLCHYVNSLHTLVTRRCSSFIDPHTLIADDAIGWQPMICFAIHYVPHNRWAPDSTWLVGA